MSVTDTQLAEARADWVGRGLDAAAFDAAVGPAPAPGTTPAAPAAPPAPAPAPAGNAPQPRWSATEAAQSVAVFRAQGVPDADIRAALRADGLSEESVASLLAPVPADTRSDDEKALERGGLNAASKAEDYRPVNYMEHPPGVDLAAFNTDALAFMQAIEAPALLGPSLVETLLESAAAYKALPEAHRELHNRTCDQDVRDLYGSVEKAQEAHAMAGALLKSDAVPLAFLEWIHASGALRSANVISQLAYIANLAGLRASVKAGANLDGLGAALLGA